MRPARILPNVFVVGAPRCGTTTTYRYLREHPEVFVPRERKELGWFSKDDGRIDDFDLYCRLFEPGKDVPCRVDISTAYLYTEGTALAIRNACGEDIRVVIFARNPVDAARSLWQFQVSRGYETLDFISAIEAEASRKAHPSRLIGWAPNYFYIDRYRYAPQVKRFIDAFGAQRVRVFIFERFFSDIQRGWRDLCEFLNITTAVSPLTLRLHDNRSGRPRSAYAGRILANPPAMLRQAARALLPPGARWKIARALETWNVVPIPEPTPLSREQCAEIRGLFTRDIDEMCSIVGADLNAEWQ